MRLCHSYVWWTRMATVPLVCDRWHRVMADPSMWSVVDVEPRADKLVYNYAHAGSMSDWLRHRSPRMRGLTLQASARRHTSWHQLMQR